MAQNKGLMSPTKDLSFNSIYAAFGDVPESRILSPEVIGLSDDAALQLRLNSLERARSPLMRQLPAMALLQKRRSKGETGCVNMQESVFMKTVMSAIKSIRRDA